MFRSFRRRRVRSRYSRTLLLPSRPLGSTFRRRSESETIPIPLSSFSSLLVRRQDRRKLYAREDGRIRRIEAGGKSLLRFRSLFNGESRPRFLLPDGPDRRDEFTLLRLELRSRRRRSRELLGGKLIGEEGREREGVDGRSGSGRRGRERV